MGGCGKSQIASELTHGHILKEKIYDPSRVFFVDATSLATLEESYASIARSNGVGSSPQDALLWLSNIQEPSFVLVDNADNPDINLAAYIPRSMNTHILITTRLHDKGRLYASAPDAFIDLEALPREDAEELLVRTAILPGVSEDVSVLVQELHCYALAVAQAGACIAFLHLPVDKYLERFRRLGTSLMDGKNDGVDSSALHGYSKVVRYTWELSYDQLPEPSKHLFNLCAFLHHTGLTQMLFHRATEVLKTYSPTIPFSPAEAAAFAALTKALKSCQDENGSFDDFAFQRCISGILSLSLMRCDPITRIYSIHPLVLDSLQQLISDHLPTSLLLMLATIYLDEEDVPFLHCLLPHVDRVTGRLAAVEGPSQPAQCHPDIAMAFSSVYLVSGRWGSAETLLQACIAGRTTGLGKTHEHTLQAATFLSDVFRGSGQLEAAEFLGRSILADWARKCGEDHLGSNRASIRLATTLFDLGQYSEAEQDQMDALSRGRPLLGEDHLHMMAAMSNLATIWLDLGRYEEAEKLLFDVLSRRKRLLGEDHPSTVWALHNLANTWSNLGRYEEAEKMQFDVLSQRRRLLGEDHPHTDMAMINLASTWSYLGRHEEAEKMELDVLSRRRRFLGDDHPDTVLAMNNLADTCSHLGRYEEAEKIWLDVLSRYRRLLGEDHPYTVTAMVNMAVTHSRLQRHDKGEELCQEALHLQRYILGEDHPDTIRTAKSLAWISARREACPDSRS